MLRSYSQFHQALSEAYAIARAANIHACDRFTNGFNLSYSIYSIRQFLVFGNSIDLEAGIRCLDITAQEHGGNVLPELTKQLGLLKEIGLSMIDLERKTALQLLDKGIRSPHWVATSQMPGKTDIVVIAASLEPELRCFIDQMNDWQEIISSDNSGLAGLIYYTGILKAEDAVAHKELRAAAIFQDQPGPTDCAALVANSIRLFKPKVIVLTGTCTGRSQRQARKTDLIVPATALTYDARRRSLSGAKQELLQCEVKPSIIYRVQTGGPGIIDTIERRIRSGSSNPRIPQIHTNPMACGPSATGWEDMPDEINGKVISSDLESYAFLRSARLTDERVEPLIVKSIKDFPAGISDSAKEQAAFWAAAFIAQFLTTEFDNLCPEGD